MKKNVTFILTIIFLLNLSTSVQAASLDELYRDIVKSDNHGYLPMFVKNRQAPQLLFDDEVTEVSKKTPQNYSESKPIDLINKEKLQKEKENAEKLKWQNTINAIANNKVTAVELDEVSTRTKNNDAKATEILAWMYTKGVGVNINLIEAYHLYQKATLLEVPSAEQNSVEIYKALNKKQKELLTTLSNPYLEN